MFAVKLPEPKRVLIVRTDRIGDVVLSTPVIKNLRLSYPQAFIAFMCQPITEEVVRGNPWIDEVIVYDKKGKHKSFLSSLKFIRELRKKKFNWAIVLHPTLRIHLLIFLSGIPYRIGWDRKGGFFLNYRFLHRKQEGEKHEVEYNLDLLRYIGVPIKDSSTYFPLKKENDLLVRELLKEKGVSDNDKLLVIHPSASCPSKRWPEENFIKLIALIKKELGPKWKIVIVTSQKEKIFAKKILDTYKDIVDLCGKLSVSQLGSLLNLADIFISNDSGPVHIASTLDRPVISIFGRKDKGLSPTRWRPRGNKSLYIHKDVGCQICYAHNCKKGFLCLREITSEEVFSSLKSLIRLK
ncbi:MAG: lipopolysaccharide heptosyltransferase II [Candidatus Omnitrophica bacterium]|nr:lipopolysaccharide heptosyltransferase II [Candidatus Omnitrophota bacterium]MCM8826264.1 lipopolysaccharide heptosyltransferase II [Candidatus Omnitrophota bacterium]